MPSRARRRRRGRGDALNRRQLLTLVALVVLGAGLSYLLQGARPLGQNVGDSPLAAQVMAGQRSPRTESGPSALKVVVFSDYRCPACRGAEPALRSAVAEDGNVQVIYKEWPIFGEPSVRAAKVALAADRQGIYPEVHRAFMQLRNFDDAALRDAVVGAGGDWERLQNDLAEFEASIEEELAINKRQAFGLGLGGTPGYLVGPLLIKGALSEGEFLRVFADARAEG